MTIVDSLMIATLSNLQDINYVPIEATSEFTTGDRHLYSRLVDANNTGKTIKHSLFNKKTVLLFASNNHYTAIVVEPVARSMAYCDGLNPDPPQYPWEVLMVKHLYEDKARRQGLQP